MRCSIQGLIGFLLPEYIYVAVCLINMHILARLGSCLPFYLSFLPSIHPPICRSIHPSIYTSASYLPIHTRVLNRPFVHITVHRFTHQTTNLSIHPSIHPHTNLSVCLSAYLSKQCRIYRFSLETFQRNAQTPPNPTSPTNPTHPDDSKTNLSSSSPANL